MADWRPPTEEEFKTWFRPDDIIESSRSIEAQEEQSAVIERLRGGRIIAVAHTAQLLPGTALQSLVLVPEMAWRCASDSDQYHFWKHEDLIVTVGGIAGYGDGTTQRYYDIRFHPRSFSHDPPRPAQQLGELKASTDDDRPPLSKADAERFCRAITDHWPEATQDWAHEQAQRFFAEKKVPRDWFRSILRSIRGPMKPGKRGKSNK